MEYLFNNILFVEGSANSALARSMLFVTDMDDRDCRETDIVSATVELAGIRDGSDETLTIMVSYMCN